MSRSSVITEAQNFTTGQANNATLVGNFYDETIFKLGDLPIFVQEQQIAIAAGTANFDLTTITQIPLAILAYIMGDFHCSIMRLRDLEATNQNWRNARHDGPLVTTIVLEENPSKTIGFYPKPTAPGATLTLISSVYPVGGLIPSIFEPALVHLTLAREYGRSSDHQDPAMAEAHQEMGEFLMSAAVDGPL